MVMAWGRSILRLGLLGHRGTLLLNRAMRWAWEGPGGKGKEAVKSQLPVGLRIGMKGLLVVINVFKGVVPESSQLYVYNSSNRGHST